MVIMGKRQSQASSQAPTEHRFHRDEFNVGRQQIVRNAPSAVWQRRDDVVGNGKLTVIRDSNFLALASARRIHHRTRKSTVGNADFIAAMVGGASKTVLRGRHILHRREFHAATFSRSPPYAQTAPVILPTHAIDDEARQ